jgi:hypothetical protein
MSAKRGFEWLAKELFHIELLEASPSVKMALRILAAVEAYRLEGENVSYQVVKEKLLSQGLQK